MDAKICMIQLMADIIAPCEAYHLDGLNDTDVWERFMAEVMSGMETVEEAAVRNALATVDRSDFQEWIDDPAFWQAINDAIERRGQVLQTLLPSALEGRC